MPGEFYQVDRLELDLEDVNPHSLHGLCLRYAVTHLDEIIDRSKMRVDTETLADIPFEVLEEMLIYCARKAPFLVTDHMLHRLLSGATGKGRQWTTLRLHRCVRLTDNCVDDIIAHCGASLERLDLSGCHRLTCDGLKRLASGCPALKALDLSYIGVRLAADKNDEVVNDDLVQHISDALPDLEELHLAGTAKITDQSIIPLLNKNKKLRALDLNGCKTLATWITKLAENTDRDGMKMLQLGDCATPDHDLALLFKRSANSLKSLLLSMNTACEKSCDALAEHCKELEVLWISLDAATNDSLNRLAQSFPKLQKFDALLKEGDWINLEELASALVKHCPSLTQLMFWGYEHKEQDLSCIAKLENLQSLAITCSKASLHEIIRNCHNLTLLAVSKQTKTDDETMALIAQNCPHLKYLCLEKADSVTDKGIEDLSRHNNMLRHLIINNAAITDDSVVALVSNNPFLVEIQLQSTGVADETAAAISRWCVMARAVSLSKCGGVTDNGVLQLLKLKFLRKLHVDGTEITDKSLEAMQQCKGLTDVQVQRCMNTTTEGRKQLKENFHERAALYLDVTANIDDDKLCVIA